MLLCGQMITYVLFGGKNVPGKMCRMMCFLMFLTLTFDSFACSQELGLAILQALMRLIEACPDFQVSGLLFLLLSMLYNRFLAYVRCAYG
jgi:hypothetical protein